MIEAIMFVATARRQKSSGIFSISSRRPIHWGSDMTIIQTVITLGVGTLSAVVLGIAIVLMYQISQITQVSQKIRAATIIALISIMVYLIGIVVVNALGGFHGLAGLLV